MSLKPKIRPQLTPIQLRFISVIFSAVVKDKDLVKFTTSKATGKTFALKELDAMFDSEMWITLCKTKKEDNLEEPYDFILRLLNCRK